VKTQEEHMHTARESGHRNDEAHWIKKPSPAYFYCEERGCPNESPG